jgi:NitT/TauT family transport system substrate-binding protein
MRRCAIVLLALSTAACQGSRPVAAVQTVRVAIHRDPIAFLPVRVAQTLGYYRREALELDISEVAGGAKAIEALLGGSVDVAAGSMSDVIALAGKRRDLRGFLLLYIRPMAAVAVAPGLRGTVRTIKDLKGRPVGVSAPGSATHQILNYLLVRNGLSPDQVSAVPVGMWASSVAALEHQQVDAAVLLGSAISAFEERWPGSGFLADTRTASGARDVFGAEGFPSLSLLARDNWIRDNEDTVQRLVRAVKNGRRWVHDHDPEEVRQMIPPESRMTAAADLRAIRHAQEALSSDGLMPPGSAEQIATFLSVSDGRIRTASVDLSTTYTNDFASRK